MKKFKILLFLILIGSITRATAQTIEIIQDLSPGPLNGYFSGAQVVGGEIYFISSHQNFGIHAITENLEMKKIIDYPEVLSVHDLTHTDEAIYFQGYYGGIGEGIIRVDINTNSSDFLMSIEDRIVQQFSLDGGVIYVEEQGFYDVLTKIHYFQEGHDPVTIVSDMDQQYTRVMVTELENYILIAPQYNDENVGKTIVFDKLSRQVDQTLIENLCTDSRYAYGFDNLLIYSCEGSYFVYETLTESMVELDLNGNQSINNDNFDTNFFNNEDYLLINAQFENNLISIRKSDLHFEELSPRITSLVDLYDKNGLIFFTEGDEFGKNKLIQSEGTFASQSEINYEGVSIRLNLGEVLMDKIHFVAAFDENTGFNKEIICILNGNNITEFREITQQYSIPVFHRIGSSIVFDSDEPETGKEFFALSYPVFTSDQWVGEPVFYPSITMDGIITSSYDEFHNLEVYNAQGQLVDFYQAGFEFHIEVSGIYFIKGRLIDGRTFVQKIIKI